MHGIYATNLNTGTIHVVRFNDLAKQPETVETFCGKIAADFGFGDETVSGVAATCEKCFTMARAER